MSYSGINALTGLAILLISCPPAFAGNSAEDIRQRMGAGDPVAGKEKSAMCQGCHGEDGNSATADYPKLAGQYAAYIRKQVNDFKSGARVDPVMSGMAAAVASDQDLLDIAAYFASQKLMKGAKSVANEAGNERFIDESNGCVSCHGANGKGLAPDLSKYPVIGGQHKEYLIKQLKDFRSRARKNDSGSVMSTVAGFMSDDDIADVASYASGL